MTRNDMEAQQEAVDQGDIAEGTKDISPASTPTPTTHNALSAPPPDSTALSKQETKTPIYSTFTKNQKRAIVSAASFAAFFSPLTGSIYFPALTTIADDLGVSASKINLTVTTYLIWQGVAPMLIASFSDNIGRRPAYMICFAIYIIANLSLSLQSSYPALLTLRMLQSAGSSGTVALANGVVADVVTTAERGQYIAFASLGAMLGPSLSPVIGGLIAQNLNWHWIFWFLLILSCSFGIPLLLFLPETGRKVVGDGSIPPPWPNMNLIDYLRYRRRPDLRPEEVENLVALRANYKLRPPNPLPSLLILFSPSSFFILLTCGLGLSVFYALSTGASSSFSHTYHFNSLQVGLMFLPLGAGGIISALTTGRIVDWNFRRHCAKLGIMPDKKRVQNLTSFPIERARLEVAVPFYVFGLVASIGYGWMLTHKISLAGPIIMLLVFGYSVIAANQAFNVLMVDLWPGKAAAATAANNLVRCGLGAAATAAIEPMSKALGRGWAYTTLSLIAIASTPMLGVLMVRGIAWRKAKAEREAKRKERREEKRKLKEAEKEAGHSEA